MVYVCRKAMDVSRNVGQGQMDGSHIIRQGVEGPINLISNNFFLYWAKIKPAWFPLNWVTWRRSGTVHKCSIKKLLRKNSQTSAKNIFTRVVSN